MNKENQPVYMIGVAARLCGVHPQTLRQYERIGLVVPSRVGAKNRLFSEADIRRVQRIQRLTQDLGVNLAGVEIILKLLDDMDEMRGEMERQFEEFRREAERKLQEMASHSKLPVRKDDQLLPMLNLQWKRPDL